MINLIDTILHPNLINSLDYKIFEPDYKKMVDTMFIAGRTISKNEMLSLLT